MRPEALTHPALSRTIRSVQSGIWAMNRLKTPQGTVWSCKVAGVTFGLFNRLAAALAKSQDHRASCGVFAFGRRTEEGKHDASRRAMMLSFFFLPFGLSGIDRVLSQTSWGGRGGLWVSVLSSFLSGCKM